MWVTGCGSGTVCPRSLKDTAFCDTCDFDSHTYMCGSVSGHISVVPTAAPPDPSDDCIFKEEKVYSGPDNDFLGNKLYQKICSCFIFER